MSFIMLHCVLPFPLQTQQDVFPFNLYSKDAETRQFLTSAAQGFVDRFVGLACYTTCNLIALCVLVVHTCGFAHVVDIATQLWHFPGIFPLNSSVDCGSRMCYLVWTFQSRRSSLRAGAFSFNWCADLPCSTCRLCRVLHYMDRTVGKDFYLVEKCCVCFWCDVLRGGVV